MSLGAAGWGGLPGGGTAQFSPPDSSGTSTLRPDCGWSSGHPHLSVLCRWRRLVRRRTSQRSRQDLQGGGGRNASPVNGAGGGAGDHGVDKTTKDQETLGQTDGHRKGMHGKMTGTLSENTSGGQLRQHLPTPPHPPYPALTPIPEGCGAPRGRAGYCTTTALTEAVPGRQMRERGGRGS